MNNCIFAIDLNKSKTPRIFLPWCFAVRTAYSVVIIFPANFARPYHMAVF